MPRPPFPRQLLGPGIRPVDLTEPKRKLSRRLWPIARLLRQAGQYEIIERGGDRDARACRGSRWWNLGVFQDKPHGGLRSKHELSRQQPVGDAPRGVDVG